MEAKTTTEMALNAEKIRVLMSNFLTLSIIACYKLFSDHSFLVALACFFVLLYKFFPLLFNLFVSAFPILVCTAGLLGTLLTFGNLEIPEIEEDEKEGQGNCDVASSAAVTLRDSVVGNQHNLMQSVADDSIKVVDYNSSEESDDSNQDHYLDSSMHMGEHGKVDEGYIEEEADDDDHGDFDLIESSSTDPSVVDIMTMLDTFDPLYHLERNHPSHLSHDGSDAGSELSNKSQRGSVEPDQVNHVVQADEQDDNCDSSDDDDDDDVTDDDDYYYNDNEEDEARRGEEDLSHSMISWTEDDQKNLMDLGCLELERNQRLENLIARRKLRKTVSMMPERNLIDFESPDIPFDMPRISTRRNPFDSPHDPYDNLGFPSTPGSAPSILAPFRNPFDSPYSSSEEKPDLKGDDFGQDILSVPEREVAFFGRHSNFSPRPSLLGGHKQERLDTGLINIFGSEHFTSERSSYDPFRGH